MRILMFLILLLQCLSLFTQNIEDAYKIWNISPEIWNDDHGGYTGEYQVFTDKLYWNQSVDLYQAAVSLSIEIVSFPFVPIGNDLTALQNSTYRILSTV